MDKILTIAICAYNMEKYIYEALSSCKIQDIDKIEVLVMNDGSTDRTEEIVQQFCDQYPDSFRLITKPNGGWGSNINLAIQLSSGTFFRILDADDWFDSDNLEKFVKHLTQTSADLVTSLYAHCCGNNKKVHRMEWEKYSGQELELCEIQEPIHLSMWGVTYRTAILKEHPLYLPEHSLYTDTLYVLKPLAFVRRISFYDRTVYNYRVGRSGQSVSVESIKKHYKEMQNVFYNQMIYYNEIGYKSVNKLHLQRRVEDTYHTLMENLLRLCCFHEIKVDELIRDADNMLKDTMPQLYDAFWNRKYIRLLRTANYKNVKLVNKLLQVRNFVRN